MRHFKECFKMLSILVSIGICFSQVAKSEGGESKFSYVETDNIGHIILDIESNIPGRHLVKNQLNTLLELAVEEVDKSGVRQISDEKKRAVATFEAIARAIRTNGFQHKIGIYPHSLTEVLSSTSKLFDCDTGSFIFLSVAEKLNLPVSMVEVEVPSYSPSREFGDHNFVRWTLKDGNTVDWDPNDENQRHGDAQSSLYGFAWTKEQLIGYVFFARGLDWEKQGYFKKALDDYEQSIRLFPTWPKAKNNVAWLFASRSELQHLGREKEALTLAKEVVALHPTANNKDTLACAYALNGDFENAIEVQKSVVAANPHAPSFADNLRKMQSRKNCLIDS